jgi:hypothetical protein
MCLQLTMPVHVAAYVVLVCSIVESGRASRFSSVTCVVHVPTVISVIEVVLDVMILYTLSTGQYTQRTSCCFYNDHMLLVCITAHMPLTLLKKQCPQAYHYALI